jgi:hypothetical protein
MPTTCVTAVSSALRGDQVAGLSLRAFRFSFSCSLMGRFKRNALRRNRLHEPLGVQLLELAALHHRAEGVVHQLLEGRVVLGQHAGIGLDLQRLAHHLVVGRRLRIGDEAEQQDVVHGKGHGAVAFHQQERVGVVLAEHDVHAQVLLAVVLAHDQRVGGAGGAGHGLLGQVGVVLDLRGLLHQQARAGIEVVDGEGHVLAARGVVGGGAALQVDRAVGDQRNAVLRGDGHQRDLQVGLVQLLLHRVDHGVGELHREPDRLVGAVQVAEGHGRLAVGERDLAGLGDLGQRVGRLRGRCGEEHRGGQGSHQDGEFHSSLHSVGLNRRPV